MTRNTHGAKQAASPLRQHASFARCAIANIANLATVTVIVTTATLPLIAGCNPQEHAVASNAGTASASAPGGSATGSSASSPTANAASSTQSAARLHTNGYGPVMAGMSISEAGQALGAPLQTFDNRPLNDECDFLRPANGPEGLAIMVMAGRVQRVDIRKPGVASDAGIQVGDAADKVKAVYGEKLDVLPHKYIKGFYFTAWAKMNAHGIKYEIDERNTVSRMHGGNETIMLVEGCS